MSSPSTVFVPPAATERVERKQHPPQPPKMKARLHLPITQAVGLVFLSVMPLLALFGLLDRADHHVVRSEGALAISARVPSRMRENLGGHFHVDVYNHGSEQLEAEVALSPEYVAHFTSLQMTPPPARAWQSALSIAPGARARVNLEFIAEEPGLHRGVLRVRAADGTEIREDISTFVFP
jgi:hypothetical protein